MEIIKVDGKNEYIKDFIQLALVEDVGDGDHTSLSCIPDDKMGKAQLLVKQDGILAGVEIAKLVYKEFDSTMKINTFINDLLKHFFPPFKIYLCVGCLLNLYSSLHLCVNASTSLLN